MSKLDKLLNKFSEEPTEDELAAEFLEILRVGDDCFSDKSKSIITQEFFNVMKVRETYSGINLKVGDLSYYCMLTESIKKEGGITAETFLKLIKIIEEEFGLFILQPERYLRNIIKLNHENQTYSIDRSFIKKDLPILILKPSEQEVKESGEFIYFKYVKKNFKKSNKK